MAEPSKPNSPEERIIRAHYIKSNHFRVIYSDGVIGSITPSGNLQINFFSQRNPIPQLMTYRVDAAGHVLGETKEERVQREGVVREVEVGVVMTIDEARSLASWVEDKVSEYARIASVFHEKEETK